METARSVLADPPQWERFWMHLWKREVIEQGQQLKKTQPQTGTHMSKPKEQILVGDPRLPCCDVCLPVVVCLVHKTWEVNWRISWKESQTYWKPLSSVSKECVLQPVLSHHEAVTKLPLPLHTFLLGNTIPVDSNWRIENCNVTVSFLY